MFCAAVPPPDMNGLSCPDDFRSDPIVCVSCYYEIRCASPRAVVVKRSEPGDGSFGWNPHASHRESSLCDDRLVKTSEARAAIFTQKNVVVILFANH